MARGPWVLANELWSVVIHRDSIDYLAAADGRPANQFQDDIPSRTTATEHQAEVSIGLPKLQRMVQRTQYLSQDIHILLSRTQPDTILGTYHSHSLLDLRSTGSMGNRSKGTYLGPFYLIFFLTLASFPPVIGYGTLTTLCGFTYGWFWGWILASVGSLCGSAISFLILRKNLPRFQHWLSKQPRFAALRQAVAVKGLPLICLIRLCPFPFTYSNLFLHH
ncbi:hypothetical protein H4Q26_003837 [Puccinia striiformis f. sp. tritici PST-130]|nr:hypothetical protein H4Q26_003837 [Puccinia striiformis f. sp. tritici PST-130]